MRTSQRLDFLAPALVVSIVIAIFAVATQLINAAGAASLSTTQMLTTWLVAVGLIVVIWSAYMISRSFVAPGAHDTEFRKAPQGAELSELRQAVQKQQERTEQIAAVAKQAADDAKKAIEGQAQGQKGLDEPARQRYDISQVDGNAAEEAWVPPGGLRHLIGRELPVSTQEVFPAGCYLEPDSIRLLAGKPNGYQEYECLVVDLNPELKNRPHETLVCVRADQTPPLSSIPRFDLVEFEGLTITPYVTDQSPLRIKYLLHAARIRPAAVRPGRVLAPWTAPEPRRGDRVGS